VLFLAIVDPLLILSAADLEVLLGASIQTGSSLVDLLDRWQESGLALVDFKASSCATPGWTVLGLVEARARGQQRVMAQTRRYPPELRERAVWMVLELNERGAAPRVASQIDMPSGRLRKRVVRPRRTRPAARAYHRPVRRAERAPQGEHRAPAGQ
jgi:hypothetical protein